MIKYSLSPFASIIFLSYVYLFDREYSINGLPCVPQEIGGLNILHGGLVVGSKIITDSSHLCHYVPLLQWNFAALLIKKWSLCVQPIRFKICVWSYDSLWLIGY